MSLSNTIAEAKSSVDRLYNIVNECYKEMTARIQALESRELDRMSYVQPTQHDRDSILSNVPVDTVRQSYVQELLSASASDDLELEYLEELKRSWVYRRNSAFRLSTFSMDRHSTTWSCLSSLSLSEVSNVSVFGLVVTIEDVNNPQRPSQTWSNVQVAPLWSLLPDLTALGSLPNSEQHERPRQILPQPAPRDSETSSILTITREAEDLGLALSSSDSPRQALHETADRKRDCLPGTPESSLEEDDAAYPCKGCGEVGLMLNISRALPLLSDLEVEADRVLILRFWKKK